ncbi:MAG: hypothetical protein WAL41_12100, partial [Mycobacterium sp.]
QMEQLVEPAEPTQKGKAPAEKTEAIRAWGLEDSAPAVKQYKAPKAAVQPKVVEPETRTGVLPAVRIATKSSDPRVEWVECAFLSHLLRQRQLALSAAQPITALPSQFFSSDTPNAPSKRTSRFTRSGNYEATADRRHLPGTPLSV